MPKKMARKYYVTLLLSVAAPLVLLSACDSVDPFETSAPCPAGPEANEADFLPLKKGDVWTFRYHITHRLKRLSSEEQEEKGLLTLALLDSECADGRRNVTALEKRNGTRLYRYSGDQPWDSTVVNMQKSVSITEDSSGILLPWAGQRRIARYHPNGLDSVTTNSNGMVSFADGILVCQFFANIVLDQRYRLEAVQRQHRACHNVLLGGDRAGGCGQRPADVLNLIQVNFVA